MKSLKQILFIATCGVLLAVGTSANAALPDHSWKGITATCPAGATPPYCLTDLDPTFKAYGNTRIGNYLSGTVGVDLQLPYNARTLLPAFSDNLLVDDLFLICGNGSTFFASVPLLVPIPAAALVPPASVSVAATICGDLFSTSSANYFNTTFTAVPVGSFSLASLVGSVVGTTSSLVDSIMGSAYNYAIGIATPLVAPYAKLYRKLHFADNLKVVELAQNPLGYVESSITQVDAAQLTKTIMLIHGWNPDSYPDKYAAEDNWNELVLQIAKEIQNTEWKLVLYHWEPDADTGTIPVVDFLAFQHGTRAAEIGHQHGQHLGELLPQLMPKLEKIHFIAHSAGSWAARSASRYLSDPSNIGSARTPIKYQITLLDPFIPSSIGGSNSSLGIAEMQVLQDQNRNGQYRLENYWSLDLATTGYITPLWMHPTNNPTVWREEADAQGRSWNGFNEQVFNKINSWRYSVDWGGHSGPIKFYADTVHPEVYSGPGFQDSSLRCALS